MKEVDLIKGTITPMPPREITDQKKIAILTGQICPYCGQESIKIDSAEIYNGVSYGYAYICRDCNAYVGCYHHTSKPLGRLADCELRAAKHEAHHYFDQLWKRRIMSRAKAYSFLSEMMGTPLEYTHIGMYDNEQCKRVKDISICLLKVKNKNPYPYQTETDNNENK